MDSSVKIMPEEEADRLRVHGPGGGNDGAAWNDGTYSGITELLRSSGDVVYFIQVQYTVEIIR